MKNKTLFITIHYARKSPSQMTALPPIPDILFVAPAGATGTPRAGKLPRTAVVDDVRYINDVAFYHRYLPDDATETEKYNIAIWFGRVKEVLRMQEKESDREKADQSRRGANAGHDLLGIPRSLRTYSDGTAFENAFEVRIGARAGLNNCPPRSYSCLRFVLEPHLYLILGRNLKADAVVTAFREFVAVGRATVVTEGQGILVFFERRETEVRRAVENLAVIMVGFGHGEEAKWRTAEGADELKSVCLNHLETLREQFLLTAVKLYSLKVLTPSGVLDPHKPLLPYYIEEGIEAEKKRREEKAKNDRAAEALKKRAQPTPDDSSQTRRRTDQPRASGDRNRGNGASGNRGGGRGRPSGRRGGRARTQQRSENDEESS